MVVMADIGFYLADHYNSTFLSSIVGYKFRKLFTSYS